jgi:amidohydrolase
MLLGAARTLATHRDFAGTVHFIFQPAEEGLGGAVAMLDDGLLERFPIESVWGMHNWPSMPVGQFGGRGGAMMAASDSWTVTFRGTGGHGGAGAHLSTDATLAQAHFISALQTIVSRNVSAMDTAVVSVGYLAGGAWGSPNVMPSEVIVRGTARSFRDRTQDLIERRMGEIAQAAAALHGCSAELDYERRYVPLVNDPASTDVALDVAADLVGEEKVNRVISPVTGAEDFSFMLRKKPGAYIFLGNGVDANGKYAPVHTPLYDFNDEALPFGVKYWVALVQKELAV